MMGTPIYGQDPPKKLKTCLKPLNLGNFFNGKIDHKTYQHEWLRRNPNQ
jgi:hypothetical protein